MHLILNEATLPRLIWRAAWRRPTTVVAVEAFILRFQDGLARLARGLSGRSIALHESGLLHYHAEQAGFAEMVFPWIERRFDFGSSDRLGIYGYAYKKACHKYATRRGNLVYALAGLRHALTAQKGLPGADSDLAALYREAFRQDPPELCARHGSTDALFAFGALALTLVGGVAAVLGRIRLRVIPRPCFLAVDRLFDLRDGKVIDEVRAAGRMVLYVARGGNVRQELIAHGTPDGLIVDRGSGCFSPLGAFRVLLDFLADWVRIASVAWRMHPRLAFELSSLAYQRVIIRADLNSYPCQFFYARDEYNTEHILRTVELRRAGSISLGLMHGTPILGRDAFAWTYVSFDCFFVSGNWITGEFGRHWPADLRVRAVGCFGLTREMLRDLPPLNERPDAIMAFISWVPNLTLVEEMIDRVCVEFPDRTVWLKFKAAWREQAVLSAMRRRLMRHSNARDTQELSLTLMARSRCAITTPSTVVSEALQTGLPVFCIDDGSWGRRLVYRRFSLVVATAQDLIKRIRDLDSDARTYDFAALTPIASSNSLNFDDSLLEELGLTPPPKGAATAVERPDSRIQAG